MLPNEAANLIESNANQVANLIGSINYQQLFENIPNPYMILCPDPPRFTIATVNNAYEIATEIKRENVVGRGLFEVFPDNPNDPTASGVNDLRVSLDRVIQGKVPDVMSIQKYDIPSREPGNNSFKVKYWSPVNTPFLDENGSVKFIIHRAEDVTEFILFRQQSSDDIAKVQEHSDQMEAEVLQNAQIVKEANQQLKILNAELERREKKIIERTAQLEAMNKELETFSYSVSHDLRAPLRAIDGYSFLLLDEYNALLDETGKNHLARIRHNSQQMGRLIADLLKLSQLTREKLSLEAVDISDIAKNIAKDLQEQEPSRNVEFTIAEGATIYGDKCLMQAVMQNLLDNAWKYTSKHDSAHIEFGITERDGKPIYFVQDDGAGFDMAYADKLFGVFQRLHRSNDFPGTGVGLATVARVINRHGGKIWAEGAVEKGSTFYFTVA
jgi:signal transduction histidine kinase